ncbi:ABC transporter permease [Streptomyces sp. M19]
MRTVLLAVAATAVVFATTTLLPGDAGDVRTAGRASDADVARLRDRLGLDRPAPLRYLAWLSGAFRGDLGHSLAGGRPVTALLGERLPATAVLVGAALAVTAVLTAAALLARTCGRGGRGGGRGVGVRGVGGRRAGRRGGLATGLAAVPQPVHAAVLVAVFAGGWGAARGVPAAAGRFAARRPEVLVLPALTLALPSAAYATALLRGALDDALARPHVADARLRGIPAALVVRRHVLPLLRVPAAQVTALVAAGLVAERRWWSRSSATPAPAACWCRRSRCGMSPSSWAPRCRPSWSCCWACSSPRAGGRARRPRALRPSSAGAGA